MLQTKKPGLKATQVPNMIAEEGALADTGIAVHPFTLQH